MLDGNKSAQLGIMLMLFVIASLILSGLQTTWDGNMMEQSYMRLKGTSAFWDHGREIFRQEVQDLRRIDERSKRKVLVIIYGTNMGEPEMALAWGSLFKHVLKPLNADLAILTDLNKCDDKLKSKVKYRWHVDQVEDWGPFVDFYAQGTSWRKTFCLPQDMTENKHHDQFGGVAGCGAGTSVVELVFREEARRHIMGLDSSYEWIVFQRSNLLFECDHPPIDDDLTPDVVHVMNHSSDLSRGMIVHRDKAEDTFAVLKYMLANSRSWYKTYVTDNAIEKHFEAAMITYDRYNVPAGLVERSINATQSDLAEFGLTRGQDWDQTIIKKICGIDHQTKPQYKSLLNYFTTAKPDDL